MADDDDIEVDATELVEIIRDMDGKLKNLPLDLYGAMFLAKVSEMFESEGASGETGMKWTPLKATTLKRHPRRRGGMILSDTGATAAGITVDENEQSFVAVSHTGYGPFHLTGTKKMAKRDFFAIKFPQFLDELGELVLSEFG